MKSCYVGTSATSFVQTACPAVSDSCRTTNTGISITRACETKCVAGTTDGGERMLNILIFIYLLINLDNLK